MNRKDVLKMIDAVLGSFLFHSSLLSELTEIIAGSGNEKRFYNLLLARLKFLSQFGISAVSHEEFELLANSDGIYSMHLARRGFNIRILYAFLPNHKPALLSAFYERTGKQATDYSNQISIAQQRFQKLLEVYHDE